MSPLALNKSKLLSTLQEKLPDRQVGLAPADAFFTRKVDLPEDLSWEDRLAFIQLNLEGNSPFPMEQLVWGYFESANTPWAFVYATPWSRLRKINFDDPGKYFQLYPGFISLYGQSHKEATVRFLSQGGVLSAIFYKPGHVVPEKIISRKITAELLTDEAQLKALATLRRTLKTEGYNCEEGLWHVESVDILSNDNVRFRHRHIVDGTPKPLLENTLALSENALWAADLRDDVLATRERNVRKRSTLIWKSLRIAIWCTIVLLIFQLSNAGLYAFNYFREKQLAEMEPRATRVTNKLTLAERLTQSTEEDLKPFLLLEAINPLRPDSIFFERVRSQSYNTLEIEGRSVEGVTPVNAFADSILQLPIVQDVKNNSQTRNEQTSFEFEITFSSLPEEPEGGFILPEEVDEESTDEEEEQEG
jgi:hypothetical protein